MTPRAAARSPDTQTTDVALEQVLATVAAADGLTLRGLMAVAPLGWEPDRAFGELAAIAARVRSEYPDADGAVGRHEW